MESDKTSSVMTDDVYNHDIIESFVAIDNDVKP